MSDTNVAEPAVPPQPRRGKRRFVLRWAWRGIKTSALVACLAMLLGGFWVIWTNHRGQIAANQAQRVVAELDLVTSRHIDKYDPDNGARLYRAAAQLLVVDDALYPVAPVFGEALWPEFGDQITPEQIDILRHMLRPNEHAFATVREARMFDEFSYEFNQPFAGLHQVSELGELRKIARWLGLRSYLTTAENDQKEFLSVLKDLQVLCNSMGDRSIVIGHLVRVSIDALTLGVIEDALSRSELSQSGLLILKDMVRPRSASAALAAALETEAQITADMIQEPDIYVAVDQFNKATMYRGMEDWSSFPYFDSEPLPWWEIPWWRINQVYRVLCPGLTQIQQAQSIRFLIDSAEIVRQGSTLDDVFIARAKATGIDYAASLAGSQKTLRNMEAKAIAAIYGLEAERFRLREGRWPVRLTELLENESPVLDPWGNRMQIRTTDRGIRIYSLGDNQQDDDGTLRWEEDAANDDADDQYFQLLSPEFRGVQPAPIKEGEMDAFRGGYGPPGYYESIPE